MEQIVEKLVIEIENEHFILKNYITTVNHKVILNKVEAALLYIELHKFLFGNENKTNK